MFCVSLVRRWCMSTPSNYREIFRYLVKSPGSRLGVATNGMVLTGRSQLKSPQSAVAGADFVVQTNT